MRFGRSLRLRLMVLILTPLVLISGVLGYWRYATAMVTAEDLFDRSLLAATLAVSRDVSVSGGDALSITTRDLIARAAGGRVFYHVAGPDRAYVTGYAYPPVPPVGLSEAENAPQLYNTLYHGAPVRALRLVEQSVSGPFLGLATVTVWQRQDERRAFARSLAARSAVLLGILILTVGLVIWFGVNRGLRPLLDLENAIAIRSSDDLSHIRREVPSEVKGIVSTLNALFGQVSDAMQARDVFISNAAHQLRNPVAGMLALVEATESAVTESERKARLSELKAAAARTARLTTQMLALERVKGTNENTRTAVDLNDVARDVAMRNVERVLAKNVDLEFRPADSAVTLCADVMMLEEALENLIDNALKHGGPGLAQIVVSVGCTDGSSVLTVTDDGRGLSPEDAAVATERFAQVRPSDGSGLGLAIVAEIAMSHGGKLRVEDAQSGARISLRFPLATHSDRIAQA
ncbi:MAG: sensor histidine kinase [Pseudomonadota bacterium]